MNIAVLIPAYKPEKTLIELLEQLAESPIIRVVVVNDGSPPAYQAIFEQVKTFPKVDLLVHPENQGKGAALKTGFRFLEALPEPVAGVVTADADGQHAIADILLVAQQTMERPDTLIVGGRRFDKDVPWKSMAGNTITRWIMRLFFGIRIYDTQTGLRGIPAALLTHFDDLPYDRFEYEQEMLMVCSRRDIPTHEVTIQTIYLNENKGTHFNPFKDSARVYHVIFRFANNWLVTWLSDYLFFALLVQGTTQIILATLAARLAALLVSYLYLAKYVFRPGSPRLRPYFRRFALLAITLSLFSALGVSLYQAQTGAALLLAKRVVEVLLLVVYGLLPKGLKRAILRE